MAKKVISVDDSASVRQMVSFTLESNGYQVITAIDGQEAFNRLKTEQVDMVITDLNMPNMDGITLIKSLRALPGYKFTPMILLTTESQEQRKQEGRAAGATGWIVKPFEQDKLLAVVKKVLG
ncbi:response regulator [Magnetospirillum sulfuroxidans]|uniref:Response regulator n=1 Tax=Magnetospirillum sulfuroxidans TaxID=611300 RepID=A0ABS5IFD0_9PROT|nr:response regulator [Magnetospirillum sulfuroxidans]MBR9972473.1 response regulator [Magnetospirillum sulfuroxidans]